MTCALYLHIPFCVRRCTYCDFNTYAGLLSLRPAYVRALLVELDLRAAQIVPPITSVYFGGGTPSLLPPETIRMILEAIRQRFHLTEDVEITLEANPGTVTFSQLLEIRHTGVNRLSLGVQSAQDAELRMLGRIHTWAEAVQAVYQARQAGFGNVSLDLIFGLPGQTVASWRDTLARACTLQPEHFSLYALSVEPRTPLAAAIAAETLPAPEPDVAADMYEVATEMLHRAGFWQYEISNWAKGTAPTLWAWPPNGSTEAIGQVSRHNLNYWRNEPWLGLGAGAHSWLKGHRWANISHPAEYIHTVLAGQLPDASSETIPPLLEQGETMMLGLRLAEGVNNKRFHTRFNRSMTDVYGTTLDHWQELGLLHWNHQTARLTLRGRLLGNQVFASFLPEE